VNLPERVEQIRTAVEGDELELRTSNSPESARSAAETDLARAPYLRIEDIMILREEGLTSLDAIEEQLLEVPDDVWPRVVDLVRSRVLDVDPDEVLRQAEAMGMETLDDAADRCLALTQAGTQCRNGSREGSKYCAAHKGYQPSEEELTARRQGLLPEA
jgi:hypothetical protein